MTQVIEIHGLFLSLPLLFVGLPSPKQRVASFPRDLHPSPASKKGLQQLSVKRHNKYFFK
jgi:hypothetical protein